MIFIEYITVMIILYLCTVGLFYLIDKLTNIYKLHKIKKQNEKSTISFMLGLMTQLVLEEIHKELEEEEKNDKQVNKK